MFRFNTDYSSRFRILKGGKISLLVSAMLGSSIIASASPSGGTVTSGTASISQNGATTNIKQASSKASINWQNFSIASNETVNFIQPDVNSITLNRVIGNETSVINGALNANGQVWLLNSNGVLFGKNAKINTSGILATTAELSDSDFNSNNYNFKNSSSNSVINEGTIEVVNNGSVILASNEVINKGTIKAVKGKVHLVGADSYSLNLNGNSLVNLTVDKGVLDSLVENSGTIIADGGEIYLTTNAVDELLKGVVNNTGIIEANSLDGVTGYVELFAHGGEAQVGGTIEALDGFVETSADTVKIDDNFKVTANTWLIDPKDFTIASSNGDITGTALSTNLATASVIIESVDGASDGNGDIFVNDTISWSSDKKLTLNAANDIFINSSITASNADGKLALYYGSGKNYYVNSTINLKAGDNFFTKEGSGSEVTWKVITALGSDGSTTGTDLQGINGNLSGNYVLGDDIDANSAASWDSNKGFDPIGDSNTKFTGEFNGFGHTISNLTINRPTEDNIGLFGYTDDATIANAKLNVNSITGKKFIAGLVGRNYNTSISNSYTTGAVLDSTGFDGLIGGLVGYNEGGNIINSYSTVDITSIRESTNIGGLVAYNTGSITNSYATGTINSSGNNSDIGGLTAYNNGGTITNSYRTGTIISTGTDSKVGGLLYFGSATNSFYDKTINSSATEKAFFGKTTAQMQLTSTYNDATGSTWNITNDGTLSSSYKYPVLVTENGTTSWKIYAIPVTFTLSDIATGNHTYSGSELALSGLWASSVVFGGTYNSWVAGTDYAFSYDAGSGASSVTGFTNAGTYSNIGVSILKDGYTVAGSGNTAGSLVIDKKDITAITGITASNKVYDSARSATLNTTNAVFTDMINGDNLTVATSTGTFTDKNAGDAKTVNITGLTLDGTDKDNYNLTTTTASTTADITKADLSVTGLTTSNKVYDGNTGAILAGTASITALGSDTVSLDGIVAGVFADKNIGTSKTVTVSGNTISGTDASNYNLIQQTGLSANITAKTINYDFGDEIQAGTTNGSEYLLSELFLASTLFGNDSSLIQASDYEFIYGGNIVTGFTDASTYTPISLRFLNNNFLLGSTNYNGTVIINNPQTNNSDIENIITTIANTTALNVNTPSINAPQVKRNTNTQTSVNLFSKPSTGQSVKKVTTSEVKSMQNSDNTVVSLGDGSQVSIINDGVNLPLGLEQEFYVSADEEGTK